MTQEKLNSKPELSPDLCFLPFIMNGEKVM
jgi:hypothetical protein